MGYCVIAYIKSWYIAKQHTHRYIIHMQTLLVAVYAVQLSVSSNFNVHIMIRIVIDLKQLYLVVCHRC